MNKNQIVHVYSPLRPENHFVEARLISVTDRKAVVQYADTGKISTIAVSRIKELIGNGISARSIRRREKAVALEGIPLIPTTKMRREHSTRYAHKKPLRMRG